MLFYVTYFQSVCFFSLPKADWQRFQSLSNVSKTHRSCLVQSNPLFNKQFCLFFVDSSAEIFFFLLFTYLIPRIYEWILALLYLQSDSTKVPPLAGAKLSGQRDAFKKGVQMTSFLSLLKRDDI